MKIISVILSSALMVTPIAAAPIAQAQPAEITQTFPALAGVNLSESQIAELAQIRFQARSQVDAIVSSEQQQSFFNTLQSGEGLRAAISAANLSEAQRTQVRSIVRESRQEASQVLTPTQKQQLLQNIRAQLMGQS